MSDLPEPWARQQAHARPISGEDLETMGKRAADQWASGAFKTLSDSVVGTIKTAGLSPEQVRRVIEFANTHAYLVEFRKEGSAHRVIDFDGGPADPSVVLKDLNDGGGGTVFDRGTLDYNAPPAGKSKHASLDRAVETALFEKFASSSEPHPDYPYANPLGELLDLREKVAGMYEHSGSTLSGLETMYQDLAENLFYQVKQAAMNGYPLGDVLRAWQPFTSDPEYVKAAMAVIGPRLLENGVFPSVEAFGASLEKTGSAQTPNPAHPLVHTYQEYCQVLYKLAETRLMHEQAGAALGTINAFVQNYDPEKLAGLNPLDWVEKKMLARAASRAAEHGAHEVTRSPGLVKSITQAASDLSHPAGEAGHGLGELLFGEGSGGAKTLGNLTSTAVKYAPHMAAGYGIYRAAETPTGQKILNAVTGDNNQPQMALPQGYGYY